jgi:hypothetical protein
MVLHLIMMIPFILVAVVIISIYYDVVSIGLAHVAVVLQPFTIPIGVSGFVTISGDFRGSLVPNFIDGNERLKGGDISQILFCLCGSSQEVQISELYNVCFR